MATEQETTPTAEETPAQENEETSAQKNEETPAQENTETQENPAEEAVEMTTDETKPVEIISTEETKPMEETNEEETATEKTEDPTAEAQTLLATGKRHLLCGEVHSAIESLQNACQLLSEKFGETADECGEAYFFYGKARLELSRMESGVLGNALTGVPEECDLDEDTAIEIYDWESKRPIIEIYDASKVKENEREELAAQVYDAMAEKEGESEKQDDEKMEKTDGETGECEETKKNEEESTKITDEGKSDKEETTEVTKSGESDESEKEDSDQVKKTETEDEAVENAEAGESDVEAKNEGEAEEVGDEDEEMADESEETAEDADKEEEEEVSNIQLAWETLDLARVIFSRHDTKEMQLKAAQAHLKLGEVSVELENYQQAIKDFKECQNIQRKYLNADDRLIAESCYQLGVAHSYNKEYAEAREQLREAMKVVEMRKGKLQETINEAGDDNKNEESKMIAKEELQELLDVIPDIEAKIKDTEDEERELKDVANDEMKEISDAAAEASSSGLSSTSDAGTISEKPVNVLLPRKRKAEDDVSEQTKKQRADNVQNVIGDAGNGHATNGVAASENGSGDAKQDEIKMKTVEEVLEKKAEADAKMDTA